MSDKKSDQKKQPLIEKEPSSSKFRLPKVRPRTYKSLLKMVLMVYNIALSSFYFGYNVISMSVMDITVLRGTYKIDGQISDGKAFGLINGAIPLGGLIGALCSFMLLQHFTRRNSLLFVNGIVILLGAFLYIPNFYSLLVVRVFQGVCIGFYTSIVNLIIKEICPQQIYGTLGIISHLNVVFGVFFGCFSSYIIKQIQPTPKPNEEIPWIYSISLSIPLIPVIIQSALLLCVFPYETPKYLLLHSKYQRAQRLLRKIYKEEFVQIILQEKIEDVKVIQDIATRQSFLKYQSENPLSFQGNQDDQSYKNDILSSETSDFSGLIPEENQENCQQQQKIITKSNKCIRMSTIVAIHLAIIQQFSGVNAVALYGGVIAGQELPDMADILPSLLNLTQIFSTLLASYLLSYFGRRFILLWGTLVLGLISTLITIGFFIKDSSSRDGAILEIVGLFLFLVIYGVSLGPVVGLYLPEIVQPTVIPYAIFLNWLASFIVSCFFPILVEVLPDQNPYPLFLFFSVCLALAFIFNAFYVVESKNRTEKEIWKRYQQISLC